MFGQSRLSALVLAIFSTAMTVEKSTAMPTDLCCLASEINAAVNGLAAGVTPALGGVTGVVTPVLGGVTGGLNTDNPIVTVDLELGGPPPPPPPAGSCPCTCNPLSGIVTAVNGLVAGVNPALGEVTGVVTPVLGGVTGGLNTDNPIVTVDLELGGPPPPPPPAGSCPCTCC